MLDNCDGTFLDKEDMLQHMASVHKLSKFICQIIGCNLSFSRQHELTYHLRAAHKDQTNFACSKCPKSFFPNYQKLAHHLYLWHQLGEYQCAVQGCLAPTKPFRGLVFRHFETEHRHYDCRFPNCDKSYSYTGHLRTHEMTHFGIKPFVCAWIKCNYKSSNKSHLVSHIRQKHLKLAKREQRESGVADHDERDPKAYIIEQSTEWQKKLLDVLFGEEKKKLN